MNCQLLQLLLNGHQSVDLGEGDAIELQRGEGTERVNVEIRAADGGGRGRGRYPEAL